MADGHQGDTAKFRAMADGTQEDWGIIVQHAAPFNRALPDRVLAHLKMLDGDFGGYPVDRLTHSLQSPAKFNGSSKLIVAGYPLMWKCGAM